MLRSGTRRDDLLLSQDEMNAINAVRRALNGAQPAEAVNMVLDMFSRTRSNGEFVAMAMRQKWG